MDPRVVELHSIMPIANLPSVMAHGILSYERAAKLPHRSVALQPVQDRRDKKQVPGGLRLNQYANLYFHARNPMLFKRLGEADELCVLSVSTAVLALEGTVMSDQNAATNYVRFYKPSQWGLLPFDDIFAMDWRDPDQVTYWRKKARKCAEVLVEQLVEPGLICGVRVIDTRAAERVRALSCGLTPTVTPVLFFR